MLRARLSGTPAARRLANCRVNASTSALETRPVRPSKPSAGRSSCLFDGDGAQALAEELSIAAARSAATSVSADLAALGVDRFVDEGCHTISSLMFDAGWLICHI